MDPGISVTGPIARRRQNFVDQLTERENANNLRRRKRKDVDQTSLVVSANMLCANLIKFWQKDPNGTFGVLRSPTWFANNRDRLRSEITQSGVVSFLDFLVRSSHVELVSEGKKHPVATHGVPTQIRAKEGFISYLLQGDTSPLDFHYAQPLIVLKNSEKKIISYEQTDFTHDMKERTRLINRVLMNNWADLDLPHSQFTALKNQGIHLEEILYSSRTVYRVFNNSTFDEGGRFYGPWWQSIPSELRARITINGKETVELDYSSIHPRILYARQGIDCPEDPYDIGLDIKHRNLVKRAFNALINARGRIEPFNDPEDGPVFSSHEVGMSWPDFLNRIRDHHPKISELFGTGIGLKFQRLDSDIAEETMLHFAKRHVPVLPVHDSFIMHHGYEEALRDVMTKAFKARTGSDIPIKVMRTPIHVRYDRIAYDVSRGVYTNYDPTDSLHELNTDYDVVFSDDPQYGPCERRLSDFFAHRTKRQAQIRQDLRKEQDPQEFAKLELKRLREKRTKRGF